MTQGDFSQRELKELGRASRRFAILTGIGGLMVVLSLAFAAVRLQGLQVEEKRLNARITETGDSLQLLSGKLQEARAAVAASRTAINAVHAGRFEQAVQLYDEALQHDSQNPYLLNLRAYALFRLRRYEEAVRTQRQALTIDSTYAWGYFDLARFLCAMGEAHHDEAKIAAQRAIALRPDLEAVMRGDTEFQRVCRGRLP